MVDKTERSLCLIYVYILKWKHAVIMTKNMYASALRIYGLVKKKDILVHYFSTSFTKPP